MKSTVSAAPVLVPAALTAIAIILFFSGAWEAVIIGFFTFVKTAISLADLLEERRQNIEDDSKTSI